MFNSNKNKLFSLATFTIVVLLFTFLISGLVFAEEPKTDVITVRIPNVMSPMNWVNRGLEKVGRIVNLETGGRVKFNLYPLSSLYKTNEIIGAVVNGAVEMADFHLGPFTQYDRVFDFVSVPFLADPINFFETYRSEEMRNYVSKQFEKLGLTLVGLYYYPPMQLASNKAALREPEDFVGQKIRMIGGLQGDFIRALGGTPTLVDYSETYTGLQQGVIDGVLAGTEAYKNMKFGEVVKYVTMCDICYAPHLLFANSKWWNSLPEDIKESISRNVSMYEDWLQIESREEEVEVVELLEKQGVEVIYLTEEQKGRWMDKVASVKDKYLKNNGENGEEILKLFTDK